MSSFQASWFSGNHTFALSEANLIRREGVWEEPCTEESRFFSALISILY